jgi:hypothetical protein
MTEELEQLLNLRRKRMLRVYDEQLRTAPLGTAGRGAGVADTPRENAGSLAGAPSRAGADRALCRIQEWIARGREAR